MIKKKGSYGYRVSRKRLLTGIVLLIVLAVLAQLGARSLTGSQAAKNILTVLAVLTVLPLANVASPLLASWRYGSLSREFYERCRVHEEHCWMLYELIITSRDQMIPVDAAALCPAGLILYSPQARLDRKKALDYLKEALRLEKIEMDVTIVEEEAGFLGRLERVKGKTNPEEAGLYESASMLLKRLSM